MKKHSIIAMFGAAAIAACLALLLGGSPGQACGVKCGVYRWAVKTIALGTVPSSWGSVTATVAQLNAEVAPSPYPGKKADRTAPVETTMFQVTACFFGITYQADKDYHLMLNDLVSHDKTIIAEVPSTACSSACDSPYASHYDVVRHTIDTSSYTRALMIRLKTQLHANALAGRAHQPVTLLVALPSQVTVSGAGYWDIRGHGKGHSDNGMEIHPIVAINLHGTTCTGPSATRVHEILTEHEQDEVVGPGYTGR